MPEEYEDIFRLRKREISEEEQQEIEEIKKKSAKNKFAFLQNEKMNLTKSEIKKLNKPELEPVVPENWRRDYKKFKARSPFKK